MNPKTFIPRALKYLGLAEIPGSATNGTIKSWLASLKAWWHDDETPWCGVFVAAILKESGETTPKEYYRAKAWLTWGIQAPEVKARHPLGSIVVLGREGGGHVGFLTAESTEHVRLLGGNQGNRVSQAWFPKSRVLGYRVPQDTTDYTPAPQTHVGDLSTSEA